MRLTHDEVKAIKATFKEIFKDGEIYLFGSRVDDGKRGGDIDLYIKLNKNIPFDERIEKKIQFKIKLKDLIGEQKIDVIVSDKKNLEKEVLTKGILL